MPRRNNKNGIRNGNKRAGGPTPAPKRTLTKKFQYVEPIMLDNATSTYAYHSKYVRPDVTKCVGAIAQFSAYELWRLKGIKVSIQAANNPSNASSFTTLNQIGTSVIWTAADFGANETISGESIMQYQNAKRNTLSLNGWKTIVNTKCMINCALNTAVTSGNATWDFILPNSTWINTSRFESGFYSGYQLFIQLMGFENFSPSTSPDFNIQTELAIEFMQPAFQTGVSSFSQTIYDAKLQVIPDPLFPDDFRTYVFERRVERLDLTGKKSYSTTFKREDGLPGILTYTNDEFRTLFIEQKSGPHFGNRRIKYDGPEPVTYFNNE